METSALTLPHMRTHTREWGVGEMKMLQDINEMVVHFFTPSIPTPKVLRYERDRTGKVLVIRKLNYPEYYKICIGMQTWRTTYTALMTELHVVEGQEVMPGEIIGATRGRLTHQLSTVQSYPFAGDRVRAEFLLEIIKWWAGKPVMFFCGEGLESFDMNKWLTNPQTESPLMWHDDNYASCVATKEILAKVLGRWEEAPFICRNQSCYYLNLMRLIRFVSDSTA